MSKGKRKRTPWFLYNVNPVHEGVYEVMIGDCVCHSLWKSGLWMIARVSRVDAATEQYQSVVQKKKWRGLAVKPQQEKSDGGKT